jgi:hypothetical protein
MKNRPRFDYPWRQVFLLDLLLPLSAFTAVTIFFLYPVSLHPGQMINGRPFEDAFEYVWYLEWYKRALFDLRVSPLFHPGIFYPGGWDLRFAAFPPIYPALLAPLTAWVGPVASYNLAVMGACIFAAYGTYALARAFGGNRFGAIIAGLAFAFLPQRTVYLGGHLNFLTGSMWLPWLLFALVKVREKEQWRLWWAAFAGMAYAMSIAGSWHFIFLSGMLLLIWVVVYLGPSIRRAVSAWVKAGAVFALVAGIVIGPFLVNAMLVRQQLGENAVFDFANTNATAVSLERFLIPSGVNPLFWDLTRVVFPLTNGQDGIATFGYLIMVMFVVGLVVVRPVAAPAMLVTLVVGVGLMLGPTLHFWGQPVTLPASGLAWLQNLAPELVQGDGSVAIPMPAYIIYKLFPPFRTFHSFSRWGLIVAPVLAGGAALGITVLARRIRGRGLRLALGALATLFVLVELNIQPLPAVTRISDMQRSVDAWLAQHPDEPVLIEYPLTYTLKGHTLYYTFAHGKKIIHGAGSIFPTAFTDNLPVLAQWPGEATLDLLQRFGVNFVLVNVFDTEPNFEQTTLPALLANPRLELIDRFDDAVGPVRAIYLFRLVGA